MNYEYRNIFQNGDLFHFFFKIRNSRNILAFVALLLSTSCLLLVDQAIHLVWFIRTPKLL